MNRLGDQNGAATVWAIALCSLITLGILAVGVIARGVALAQRTASAADLSALAGATALLELTVDPCAQAATIAVQNASDQVRCTLTYPEQGPQVEIVVRSRSEVWPFGTVEQVARAGVRPAPPPG